MPRLSPVRIFPWDAASTRGAAQNGQHACAPCLGRRCRGIPLSRHSQPAGTTTPRTPTQQDSGQQLAGARPAVQTRPTVGRQGQTRQCRARGHRPGTGRCCVGYCPGGASDTIQAYPSLERPRLWPNILRRCTNGHEQRRRPGVVSPAAACREPTGTLVPRWRQAPDGGKYGGPQPTHISRINHRFLLAPPLLMHKGKKMMRT
jgi:hypothetical protein